MRRLQLQPHTVLLCLLGVLLGVMIGSGGIRSYDVWWHLRMGQDILHSGRIVLYDEYSHTAPGGFRPPQQWLFEVVQAAVFALGRDAAMVWLRMLLMAAALGLLALVLMRRGSGPILTAVMLVLVASASMPTVTLRPHLAMPLLLMALLWLVEGGVHRPRLLWAVPLLFVLWVNVHASFTLALALVAAWMAWRALGSSQRLGDGLQLSLRGLGGGGSLLAVCVAACLVNPVGLRLLWYSLQYLPGGQYADYTRVVQEWQPPNLGSVEMAATSVLLLGGALLLLARSREVSLFHLLATGLMVMMALRWSRGVMPTVFVMAWVVTPLLTRLLADLSPTLLGWRPGSPAAPDRLVSVLLALLVVAGPLALARPVMAKNAVNVNLYPESAVQWVLSHQVRGNMHNPYHWGGYLVHRLFPRHRVFIDGRVDMYGDEVLADWQTIQMATGDWQAVADKYDVQWGITQTDSAIAEAVAASDEWVVVHRDVQALVFVRRDGPNAHLAAAYGTR